MEHQERAHIEKRLRRQFDELDVFGPPHSFRPRQLSGLYAVASICYHGNDHSAIRDETFDALCDWILENFNRCAAEGANMLDREMLSRHTGYDVSKFVKPYHDEAAVLVGHDCACVVCGGSR